MIPARLSFRYEFTPVPSCGSVFVYMIPAQHLVPERVIPVRFHPGNCNYIKFEKVDCFVNLIIVMLSNPSQNPVLLAFCTSLEKILLQLLGLPITAPVKSDIACW